MGQDLNNMIFNEFFLPSPDTHKSDHTLTLLFIAVQINGTLLVCKKGLGKYDLFETIFILTKI